VPPPRNPSDAAEEDNENTSTGGDGDVQERGEGEREGMEVEGADGDGSSNSSAGVDADFFRVRISTPLGWRMSVQRSWCANVDWPGWMMDPVFGS